MTARTRHIPLAVALASLALLGGCRGDRSEKPPRQFLPDMDDSPRWNPQQNDGFYADGRTMRLPPSGTVAFGRSSATAPEGESDWGRTNQWQRASLLRDDAGLFYGLSSAEIDPQTAWEIEDGEAFAGRIPMEVTLETLELGRERFNIYCAVCHGYSGEGGGTVAEGPQQGRLFGGMVGRRWSYNVPSLHDEKYLRGAEGRTGRDGYLFYTARHGVQGGELMPGYAHALDVEEAWAVVAYIRALQESRRGSLADVPEAQREILERQRPSVALHNAEGGDS